MTQINELIGDARRAHAHGRFDDAQRIVERVLAQEPDDPRALELAAILALRRGDSETGIALLEKLAGRFPELASLRFNLGRALYDAGRVSAAREELQRAHELAPEQPDFARAYAMVLRDEGAWQEASAVAQALVAASPDDLANRHLLAGIELLRGELVTAREHLRQIAEHEAAPGESLLALGSLCLQGGDFSEAADHFRSVLAKSPRLLEARLGLAHCAWQEGNELEALRSLEKLAKLHPEDPRIPTLQARIALEQGSTDAARKVIDHSEHGATPHLRLERARLLCREDALDAAQEILDALTQEAPDTLKPMVVAELARLADGNGNAKRALELLEQANEAERGRLQRLGKTCQSLHAQIDSLVAAIDQTPMLDDSASPIFLVGMPGGPIDGLRPRLPIERLAKRRAAARMLSAIETVDSPVRLYLEHAEVKPDELIDAGDYVSLSLPLLLRAFPAAQVIMFHRNSEQATLDALFARIPPSDLAACLLSHESAGKLIARIEALWEKASPERVWRIHLDEGENHWRQELARAAREIALPELEHTRAPVRRI